MNKNNNIWGNLSEVFLGIALILGLLLPHTSNILMLVNPILCVIFILINGKSIYKYGLAPILAIVIAMLLNMSGAATGKSMLMSTSIILCIAAFPMIKNVQVKNIYIYLIFGFIFLSQVSYMFNLNFISSFIDTYYPISWGENFIIRTNENVTIENYQDYRLGGLYRNPNQCAKYVTFLLGIYLVTNSKTAIKKQLWFAALCYLSILFTGSRTGFVIGSILVVIAFFRNQRASYASRTVVSILIAVFVLYNFLSGEGGRGADIEAGLHNSAGSKFRILIDYLSNETSITHYLFGHLDYSLFEASYFTTYSLDSEYGYIIYCFGFVGLFAFIYYVWKIYQQVDKTKRLFFVVLLWMISSSIFMAYRSCFVFLLLLSTLFSQEKSNGLKSVKQNNNSLKRIDNLR